MPNLCPRKTRPHPAPPHAQERDKYIFIIIVFSTAQPRRDYIVLRPRGAVATLKSFLQPFTLHTLLSHCTTLSSEWPPDLPTTANNNNNNKHLQD